MLIKPRFRSSKKSSAGKCGEIIEKSSNEIKEDIIEKELEENKVIESV